MSRTLRLCLALMLLAGVKAGAQEPDSARTLYAEGREAQLRVQPLRAIELYRAALRRNPDYLQPMIGLAETFLSLEQYPEALDHVVAARKYDQTNLELLVLEGRIRLGLGQTEQARTLFETVLARERNNLEARYALAELDISLGHRRQAAKRYLETLQIRPESEKALLSLALLTEEEGDREAAKSYLEQALRYHSYDPQVHYTAGRFALNMGDPERAERYLRTAVALDEGFNEARRLLAHALSAQNKAAAAVTMLRRILEDDRNSPLVWYTLGTAYAQAGDTGAAINSLARVLQIRPDDEIARFALENLALDQLPINDPVRQKYGRYHLERGRLFEERNFLNRALLEYRRCLRLDPESKQPRLEYGQVFLAMGYPDKYRQELRVLRDLGFDDSIILDDLEIIDSQSWDWVSSRWDVSQYELDKRRVSLRIFHLGPESRELHPQAGEVASGVFSDLLLRYDAVNVAAEPTTVEDFQEAFRDARDSGVNYFVIVSVEESERSFTVRLNQYLAATGKQLLSDRVYRTGNDRVLEALDTLADRFAARLPLKGTLLERRFDRGIVDLGRLDGLEAGEKLVIVKKGAGGLDNHSIGFVYDDRDRIGEFTVVSLDENLAEGTVTRREFFDLINPGDELFLPPPEEPEKPPAEMEADRGLLQRLLGLIGF